MVPVDTIRPNPYQPRMVFEEEALAELTASIRQSGLIQPLVVRADGDGHYELIAGERRFQASRRAGLEEVPVVVRPASRREMLELAMVENLQREDLNPVEEAEAYQRLATEFGLTQEEIATRVGKSRSAVTNALRLLTLPEEVLDDLSAGTLTAGHARAILALPENKERLRLAQEIKRKGLSVRQVEERSRDKTKTKPTARKRSHPALEAWEERLRNHYGTQVRIVGGLARGRVEISYFNEEDLERILELTGVDTGL
jgi:ParB family chromosome partitioning protein